MLWRTSLGSTRLGISYIDISEVHRLIFFCSSESLQLEGVLETSKSREQVFSANNVFDAAVAVVELPSYFGWN